MIIIGHVKNIPSKNVYITNAYNWDILLDSVKCENDYFQFNLDTIKFPEPFLASICIKNEMDKIEQLSIINYKMTSSKDTFSNTGFMLSLGKTEIQGDYNNKFHRVFINPNNENDLLFDQKTENFASTNDLKKVKEIVLKNSSSYFLLNKLYNYKHLYSSTELKEILLLFKKRVRYSATGLELLKYANFLIKKGLPFPNPSLSDSKNNQVFLLNDSAKLYMLVFWASWCGPCIREIPALKNIQKKFSDLSLSIKSISIDENSSNWLEAMEKQSMNWEQYLIPNNDLLKIKAQFSINSIPTTIFLDSNHIEIKRFIGYSENNIKEYNDFIKEYFKE